MSSGNKTPDTVEWVWTVLLFLSIVIVAANLGGGVVFMETDWRQECAKLHIELDKVRAECAEWKEKWERLMQFKEAPRLPLRGRSTLDCVGTDKGKASTQMYTTVGWDSGEDWK